MELEPSYVRWLANGQRIKAAAALDGPGARPPGAAFSAAGCFKSRLPSAKSKAPRHNRYHRGGHGKERDHLGRFLQNVVHVRLPPPGSFNLRLETERRRRTAVSVLAVLFFG